LRLEPKISPSPPSPSSHSSPSSPPSPPSPLSSFSPLGPFSPLSPSNPFGRPALLSAYFHPRCSLPSLCCMSACVCMYLCMRMHVQCVGKAGAQWHVPPACPCMSLQHTRSSVCADATQRLSATYTCIHMCLYVHACMHTCKYAYTHMHTRTCPRARAQTHMHTRTSTHAGLKGSSRGTTQ